MLSVYVEFAMQCLQQVEYHLVVRGARKNYATMILSMFPAITSKTEAKKYSQELVTILNKHKQNPNPVCSYLKVMIRSSSPVQSGNKLSLLLDKGGHSHFMFSHHDPHLLPIFEKARPDFGLGGHMPGLLLRLFPIRHMSSTNIRV